MDLEVGCKNGQWRARWGNQSWPCAIGRGGVSTTKREGDGAPPVGCWPLRQVFYRPDRLAAPATVLPCRALTPADGWCDDPADRAYNRLITLPYGAGHETLWRDDQLYDIVVVLAHNDDPPVPGLGSAIFLHLARDDFGPTEGCVALALRALESVLREAGPGTRVCVAPGPT